MEVQYIGRLLHKRANSFKQVVNNPIALTRYVYITDVLPSLDKYMITDKADGVRAIAMLDNHPRYITSERTERIQLNRQHQTSILDCELVDGVLYAFDAIMIRGQNISKEHFSQRYALLVPFVNELRCTHVKCKAFVQLTVATYQTSIMNMINDTSRPYKVDGIIFTRVDNTYERTQNYKWKPPDQLTVDFFVCKDTNVTDGQVSCTLLVGTNIPMYRRFNLRIHDKCRAHVDVKDNMIYSKYFPVPFECSITDRSSYMVVTSEEADKMDGHIVELSWDTKMGTWVYHRIRSDKDVDLKAGTDFGNNYRVAEITLQQAMNPLTLKDLITSHTTLSKEVYFKKTDDRYVYVRQFNNDVKRLLITQHKSAKMLDLASGKGQDLPKYSDVDVHELTMVDSDPNALEELLQRKYNILGTKRLADLDAPVCVDSNEGCRLTIQCMDLNAPYTDNDLKTIFPTIICNLALHYMMYTPKAMANICAFIDKHLSADGTFVFTALDGRKVFNLVQHGPWIVKDRYHIELVEKSALNTFTGFEVIDILLPCSASMYKEPLINIHALDAAFSSYNILRVEEKSFDELFDANKRMETFVEHMDEYDRTLVGLYKYVVYKRMAKNK